MTPLKRLRAEAARHSGAPKQATGPSKKELAMKRVAEEHHANVDLYFSNLVESVPIAERGSVRVNPDIVWFNEAAHHWGLLRLKADNQVRRDVLSNNQTAVLPSSIPSAEQRQVYKRGYVLWYLCGRPKPKLDPMHAEGQLTELVKYTATIDPANPQGSGADRFKNTLVDLNQLNSYASQAYDHHLKSAPTPSRPIEVKRVLPQPASERVVVQRQFVPQALVPLARAKVAEVGVQFLETPESLYTFRASNLEVIRRQVAQHLSTDRVFRVSPMLPDGAGGGNRPCDYKLANGIQANGEMIYSTLRDRHGIDALFSMPSSDIYAASNWSVSFRELGLALVARGSYNSVWRLARGPNGSDPLVPDALRSLFPEHVIEGFVRDELVLRIPKQWASYNDVLSETVNVTEAALGRYGPNVAAMWVARESKPEMVGTGSTQGRFKLFAILERGTDVATRISQMTNQPHAVWQRYFRSLRLCIWRVSANRCFHFDGKLANLVDSFPSSGVTVDDKTSTIKAIDLASDFYRRIERLTPEEGTSATMATSPEMAQGWRLVWLYNILFVTCSLRLVLTTDVYLKVWWPSISKAVKSVLQECVSGRSLPNHDAEYMRARSFLMQCKWSGGFLMAATPKKPPDGYDPSALSATALGMVRLYFHDHWYNDAMKRLVEPARRVRLASRNDEDATQLTTLRQERNQSWAWYNVVFRPRALPMVRFFAGKMEEDAHRALPMVQVLYDYADAPEEDLYPLTAGSRHPLRPMQIVSWPMARKVFDEKWLDSVSWEDSRVAAREIGFRV